MWETISKLGITSNDKQEESVKAIEKMEIRDKEMNSKMEAKKS